MTALLLKASDFQPPDDPAIALAERREGTIAAAIADALQTMGDAIDAHDLRAKIMARDSNGIAEILTAPAVVDALRKAYGPIADTFITAAKAEAVEKFGGLIVYDPIAAAAALSGAQENFIGSILGQSADVVANYLINAVRDGADPDEVASALRAVIGLTPQQAQAVANFRRLLQNADREALLRALRDRRFDATVQSWIEGSTGVDLAKVDAMVERYAARMLAFRADTIARTESLQAVVGGIRSAYVQAVSAGRLLESEVTRKWRVVFDERLCAICGSIPLLNPNGVGVNEPYTSLRGTVMAPLAHPRCRCTEVYTADLSRVQANPFAMAA